MSNTAPKLPKWLIKIEDNPYLVKSLKSNRLNAKLFRKLLADTPQLESMWMSLKKRQPDKDIISCARDFKYSIESSLVRTQFSRQSKKELEKNGKRIAELSEELSFLLKSSDFDTDIFSAMNDETTEHLWKNLSKYVRPIKGGFPRTNADELDLRLGWLWASSWLTQLSEYAQKKGIEKRPVTASNTINSDQTYFIRKLTHLMREQYNQPLRGVVATSTAVIFNNEDIDIQYIAKMAP